MCPLALSFLRSLDLDLPLDLSRLGLSLLRSLDLGLLVLSALRPCLSAWVRERSWVLRLGIGERDFLRRRGTGRIHWLSAGTSRYVELRCDMADTSHNVVLLDGLEWVAAETLGGFASGTAVR